VALLVCLSSAMQPIEGNLGHIVAKVGQLVILHGLVLIER